MNYAEAKKVMYGIVGEISFAPKTVEVRYPGKEVPTSPQGYWIRPTTIMADEVQATLSDDVGAPGQKRYNSAGILIVQMFAPKTELNSDWWLLDAATKVQKTLRQASGKHCVNFRNVRIADVTPEDQFYRYNVIAEFEFDQIS